MKKFIQKVSLFSAFCLLLIIGISVIIDPYNVFHTNNIRDNGIEPNNNYIKMSYLLEGYNYDTLLFGSSRVGAIHTEKIKATNCYNMSYSEGIPAEHLANIKTLIAHNYDLKRIYIGLDSLSYTIDPLVHQSEHCRCPYEYCRNHPFHFFCLYLDSSLALDSLKISRYHVADENHSPNFYNYGWWCEYNEPSNITTENTQVYIGSVDRFNETLSEISEIVSICKDAGIELIIFTNPMYYVTYDASLDCNYLEFLKELSSITDFYNFSGINDITLNPACYYDSSHYNAEVGDLMIEYMCNGKKNDILYEQGFGVYVTPENIEDVLALLDKKSGLTDK